MIFFQKVSQFVSISASPKHPQSETGLFIAKTNVSGVKNNINKNAIQIENFLNTPTISDKPITNSTVDKSIARTKDIGTKNSSPKALK